MIISKTAVDGPAIIELEPGGGPSYRAAILVANDNERTIGRVSKEQLAHSGRKIRKPKARESLLRDFKTLRVI